MSLFAMPSLAVPNRRNSCAPSRRFSYAPTTQQAGLARFTSHKARSMNDSIGIRRAQLRASRRQSLEDYRLAAPHLPAATQQALRSGDFSMGVRPRSPWSKGATPLASIARQLPLLQASSPISLVRQISRLHISQSVSQQSPQLPVPSDPIVQKIAPPPAPAVSEPKFPTSPFHVAKPPVSSNVAKMQDSTKKTATKNISLAKWFPMLHPLEAISLPTASELKPLKSEKAPTPLSRRSSLSGLVKFSRKRTSVRHWTQRHHRCSSMSVRAGLLRRRCNRFITLDGPVLSVFKSASSVPSAKQVLYLPNVDIMPIVDRSRNEFVLDFFADVFGHTGRSRTRRVLSLSTKECKHWKSWLKVLGIGDASLCFVERI